MGRQAYERISQREYGRRLGVSNETVRKAIEAGKVSKGWDKKAGKIVFELANEEWGNTYLNQIKDGAAAEADAIKRVQGFEPPNPTPAPKKPQAKKPQDEEMSDEEAMDIAAGLGDPSKLDLTMQFAEAVRREKVYTQAIKGVEYAEKVGKLVNKGEVYRQLFGFGQSVRSAVLAVADRATDELLAAPNRATAHQILTQYLHEALTKLTEGEALSFQETEDGNAWGFTNK